MSLTAFKDELLSSVPATLAAEYFQRSQLPAFETVEDYQLFQSLVKSEVQTADLVAVVGTGNWRYSLNPEKNFKEFNETSDIDVAVVSIERFQSTWEQLREFHRSNWWSIPPRIRQQLRRNGENVYSGFVSASWIPDARSPFRYAHKSMLNRLSNNSPGRREVKIMYFKDKTEAIDYYSRGFAIGQKRVSRQ